MSAPYVTLEYISVTRSAATPGGIWYAGVNSVDGGSNTGWTFTGPPPQATADLILPTLQGAASVTAEAKADVAATLSTIQSFSYGLSLADGGSGLFLPVPIMSAQAAALASADAALSIFGIDADGVAKGLTASASTLMLPQVQLQALALGISGATALLTLPLFLGTAESSAPVAGGSLLVLPQLEVAALAELIYSSVPHAWLAALAGPVEVFWSAGSVLTSEET